MAGSGLACSHIRAGKLPGSRQGGIRLQVLATPAGEPHTGGQQQLQSFNGL